MLSGIFTPPVWVASAVIGLSGIPPASTEKEVIAKEDRIKR